MKRILCIILSCMLLVVSGVFDVFASGIIDPTKPVSLSITYKYEDTVIPDTGFDIYYIATVDEDLKFTLVPEFTGLPIPEGPELTQNDWNAYADTLKAYVQTNSIPATYHATTDSFGNISLTGLTSGMYFYFGEKHSMGGYTYLNQAGLISLPNLEAIIEHGEIQRYEAVYDVSIFPKVSRSKNPSPTPSGGGGKKKMTTMRKVIIEWDDNDEIDARPLGLPVYLLKDGVIYDTVMLSAADGWRYTWTDLPEYDDKGARIEWSVFEEAPSGYVVKKDVDGVTTILVHMNGEVALQKYGIKLPQTGLLWWPVPLLICLGIIFILIGIVRRRSSEE